MNDTSLPGLPAGATARVADGRASIILDVTGLSAEAADALERQARGVAEAAGLEARVARTASRVARRLIAVASGKGGVGKSTVSANLAVALAKRGRPVGVVDADISGPSQPRLFGVEDATPDAADKRMFPVQTPAGVGLVSMGMLVPRAQAIAWRGPMLAGALSQLLDAHWGSTDPLILDLPPGTGDVQLTMVQKHRPAGAVIVSTPQDLALIDARRAIDFFEKAGVPIIGLIENMAGYACPHCGEVSDPFGSGGAQADAERLGLPFLGRIPLSRELRAASDAGTPPAAGNGPDATAFDAVAQAVDQWLRANGG
ncbi:Mrp/NBP35 family ATP-binding protein [uncultured Sphingomonas sp.]|uniref:Mrp/NBP35 family ATP-binding protein n=1 Tax=uncultured Sphingomonas sp. TaxID=158754 RepID=UPI00374A8854